MSVDGEGVLGCGKARALVLSVVLVWSMFWSGRASGSVVSRLGAVFLYDPLTFDAGSLQRGGWVRGGAGTGAGELEVAGESTFFRDFSLRVSYRHRFEYGAANGVGLGWRFRFPIIESARFRHFTSTQFYYQGSHGFLEPDAREPDHEVGAAESLGFPVLGLATSFHAQLGVAIRSEERLPDVSDPARVGGAVRLAYLFQLYNPPRGRRGLWTVTFSVVEFSAVHFGRRGKDGSGGRMRVSAGAPAIHFSPRGACYTLGLAPVMTWTYGADGSRLDWGGLAVLSVSHRNALE